MTVSRPMLVHATLVLAMWALHVVCTDIEATAVACLFACKSNGKQMTTTDGTCRGSLDACFTAITSTASNLGLCGESFHDWSFPSSAPEYPVIDRSLVFNTGNVGDCNRFLRETLAPVAVTNAVQPPGSSRAIVTTTDRTLRTDYACSCTSMVSDLLHLAQGAAFAKTTDTICSKVLEEIMHVLFERECKLVKKMPFLKDLCKQTADLGAEVTMTLLNAAGLVSVCGIIVRDIIDLADGTSNPVEHFFNQLPSTFNTTGNKVANQVCGYLNCDQSGDICRSRTDSAGNAVLDVSAGLYCAATLGGDLSGSSATVIGPGAFIGWASMLTAALILFL